MQNFSDLVQKEHFQIWSWMERGRKNMHFSTKNWPYLRNGERYGQCYYWSPI